MSAMDRKSVLWAINKGLGYLPVVYFLLGLSLVVFAEQYEKVLYMPSNPARRMVQVHYSRETRIVNWRIIGLIFVGSSFYHFKKGREGLS